jgi:tetratricopeptide (TPR) repeat protein
VKARHHALSIATLAGLLSASGLVSVGAQPIRQPPRPDTPRLMVQVFGSEDKIVGPQASDALRDRMIRAFPSRVLWVFGKEDVVGTLEQSGYPTNEQLARTDEAALAKMLRADEYIRGSVTHDGENYRVNAVLVLTRGAELRQPLPEVVANRPDRAAPDLVRHIQDARKQLDAEKKCMDLARQEKLDEAVAAADAGIAAYANATLVRYCKLNVLVRRKAAPEAKLAMANEILAIDPNSGAALAIAADAQQEAGNVDAANELLVRLLATDPTNASLATRVVDALAASRKYDVAKEIVLKAVADNPGDLGLIRLQFLILTSAGDYKPAIKTGEELVQMDTSFADATYFQRMAALYVSDSQPQKASETLALGTQKFPADPSLWQFYAQVLRNSGQIQQSITASRRALEIDPGIDNGWTQIAIAYNELQMPDSALMALRNAKEAGDDADAVGGYALNLGNQIYRAAVVEEPKVAASFERALPFLHFADSTVVNVETKTNAKLIIGVSSYYIAASLAQGLAASKSCEDAQRADAAATNAVLYTQQGGRASPETALQVLPAANELLPYTQSQVKTLCK